MHELSMHVVRTNPWPGDAVIDGNRGLDPGSSEDDALPGAPVIQVFFISFAFEILYEPW